MSNNKIGITGGNGFIGNNFVEYLANKGYKVVSFDKESFRQFDHKNIEWKSLDLNLCSASDFKGLIKLVHFAGSHTAEMAFEKNVKILKKTLDAVSNNPLMFYLISTYAVFGDRQTPADAQAPLIPLDDYSKSKAMAEEELQKFISAKKINGIIVRPNSLYGRYGKNFIDVIVDKIKNKEEIQMIYFKNQFHHVSDFCKSLEYVINIENPNPSYNIESEEVTEQTLKNIFEKLDINYVLHNKKVRSYWSKGINLKRDHSVEGYLTEAKRLSS